MKTISQLTAHDSSKRENRPLEGDSEKRVKPRKSSISRRSFLRNSGAIVAGTVGAGFFINTKTARASGGLTPGDAALLRFPAALELLEADFWIQYNELGGIQDSEVPGGSGSPLYTAALSVLDSDMAQYVHDNTEDEFTHFTFLNAYLEAHGAEPANLDRFKTLPSSQATGARQIGRLTNLMQLTVDTSWWTRYRSATNPDLGAKFDNAVPSLAKGKFTAIPRTNADLGSSFLSQD